MTNKQLDKTLSQQMLLDSALILSTVDFIKSKIEQKLLEIDSYNNDNIFDDSNPLVVQVLRLLDKLYLEEKRMDEFMLKYKKEVDEKETILSNKRKNGEIYVRGFCTYTRRKKTS